MANVKLPRPGDEIDKTYLENLINELEYILNNLDEDNMTDSYKKKVRNNGGV